jgi:hypothetical protein
MAETARMTGALDRIDTLDLAVVRKKLVMPVEDGGYNWPAEATEQAIEGYRDFLKQALAHRRLRAEHEARGLADPGPGPAPDRVVDIVWHTHILFTEKYHADCEAIFGGYLHHRPTLADEDLSSGKDTVHAAQA